MPGRPAVIALLLTLTAPGALRAQHEDNHVVPRVPQALLERPTVLRPGSGPVHDAVRTRVPEAQQFYDQGLSYLHSYVWIEAARSFHQALRLDPDLAAAWSALSMVYVELNKPDEAAAAMATARRLAPAASEHERRHVELRESQAAAEHAGPNSPALSVYRGRLAEAVARFPNDVEFRLLQGLATSPDPSERGQGTAGEAIPHFEQARRLAPNHPGAHHYLTHALENANRIPEALAEARAYVALAPEVPHAHHMLGHDLRRDGRVAEAITAFETADRLQRAYFARENVPASLDWHHHHNLDLLAQSYAYVGRVSKASALFRTSFDLPSNLVTQVFNKREWPAFLRANGRLDDALAAARTLIAHPHPLIQATGHIETGFTLAARNDVPGAGASFNTALRILRGNPEGAPLAADSLLALQGELSLRTAAREKGRVMFEDVARRLRAKPGPDNWAQALFTIEAMARVARQVGDWDLAGRLARHMMDHDPAYAGSHYALGLVLDRQEDAAGAKKAFAEAVTRWTTADPDLPSLVDARRRAGLAK